MGRRSQFLCTVWLIVQVVLPFTPPFPVCDLSDLFKSVEHRQAHTGRPAIRKAFDENDYSTPPAPPNDEGRLKTDVVWHEATTCVEGPGIFTMTSDLWAIASHDLPRHRPLVL